MDAALEKAIDEAGRDRVFQRARGYGWTPGHDVPKWVWWQIVGELKYQPESAKTPLRPADGLAKSLFGFDLW